MPVQSMTLEHNRIAFIDLEASGLGSNSFPTELGWAIIKEDGSVESSSCLVKPLAKWTLYKNAWDQASERLTGITQEMLERDGLNPGEVMARFYRGVGDRQLFSDNPDFDAYWLAMLADAAGTSVETHKIGQANRIVGSKWSGRGTRHRAEADARRLAVAFVSGNE